MNKVLIISVLVLKLCLSQDLIKDEIVENHNNDEEVVCYRGGCSGEVCSPYPDIITPCTYEPEYECFENAVCEPQFNKKCGFTITAELIACLIKAHTLY
jgi:hypothetical protein